MAKAKLIPQMRAEAQRAEQPAAADAGSVNQGAGARQGRVAARQVRCRPSKRRLWTAIRSRFETAGYTLYERLAGLTEDRPAPLPAAAAFIAHALRLPAPRVAGSITVSRPRAEVLKMLVQLRAVRRFLRDVERVETADTGEGGVIAVRSPRYERGTRAGVVTFAPAPGDRGTEVKVVLAGAQPRGRLARAFAKLVAEIPRQRLRGDLRRFRQWVEIGEIPTTAGQPSGRRAG
jgi:hypothetical protein